MSNTKDPCQIALVLELIGGKWKGPIIWWLREEPRRFNELRRLLPEITPRTLTNCLRELERDGLLKRTQYPEIPPRVEYQATKLCKSLIPLLDEISAWGKRYGQEIKAAREKGH